MQQLLTGKKRFPGFTEEWNMVPLENLCVKKGVVRGPFGGALKKEFFVESGYKVYEQKNAIYGTTELGSYYIDADKFNKMLRFSVQPEDLIISCSGTIGKIYKIPHKAPEGVINQALLKLTLDTTKVDVEFFLQQFNSERIQYLITESTQGGAMKNLIGMSEFRKTKFYMPEIDEQKRISQTLIRFDIEYSNLRIQRNVLVEQKKGLMQKLLTGEVRVKID
jgi:type I restriction enzyme S subunit